MNNEQLKNHLKNLSREELEAYTEKLVFEKIDIQKDLITVGNTLIMIMQTLGVMNKDFTIVKEKSAILGSITSFATSAMITPGKLEKKFEFITEAAPLLEKYKHLLKQN